MIKINKFKKRESALKRFYYRRNKLILERSPRKRRRRYRYRRIMEIKARRLDIRIRCHSCRLRHIAEKPSRIFSIIALDIGEYMPFDKDICAMCRWYMGGGLHI